MAAMYGAANELVYRSMMPIESHTEESVATFAEVSRFYGVESGVAYPQVVGEKTSVSAGSFAMSGNLFFYEGAGQLGSESAILIGLQRPNQDVREVLEVPISKINFVIDNEQPSSVTFTFQDMAVAPEGYTHRAYALDTSQCKVKIQWGWWTPDCPEPTLQEESITSETGDEGMSGLVQKANLYYPGKYATVVVSEEQYREVLGATTKNGS